MGQQSGQIVLEFTTTISTRIFIATVKIKDYKTMINGKAFFDQIVKKDKRTYEKIQKNKISQGNDYYTVC